MKNTIVGFVIILILVGVQNCTNSDPSSPLPPPPVITDTLTLVKVDVTHRSITLNVISTDKGTGKEIKLIRKKTGGQDTLVSKYKTTTLDTTIIDDNNGKGLQLETNYTYYAVRIDSNGVEKDSSNILTAQTLGATSHDYTWEEFTIGDPGYSNALYDVWGTDENNVYAVGGVRINDTTYGVIHWDGYDWSPLPEASGGYAIFGFGVDDIWIAGGRVVHFNGEEWEPVDHYVTNGQAVVLDQVLFDNRSYTSIWGTSSENLYFGNLAGKIVHWNGSRAELMDVQASEAIRDIYGLDNNNIYAVAGSTWDNQIGELYKLNSTVWQLIKSGSFTPVPDQLRGPFETVWISKDGEIIIGAHFLHRFINGNWNSQSGPPNFYIERIRGNKPNDLFACGHFGGLAHNNGVDWYEYEDIYFDGALYGLLIKNNNVFTVGRKGHQAIIYKGTKN